MNKTKRNYYVDVLIGAAFVVTAFSALAFLVPLDWVDFSITTVPTLLGVNYGIWQILHKYAGIAMMAGVVIHLLLHWQWIIAMTKKALPSFKTKKAE